MGVKGGQGVMGWEGVRLSPWDGRSREVRRLRGVAQDLASAPPRGGSSARVAALPVRGRGAGLPPGALRPYLPRHQRFSSASQWLNHVPFALLRRSMATWWRAHQPSWLAGGVGSGAWLGAAGWSLLAAS